MPSNEAKIYKAIQLRLDTLSVGADVVEPNDAYDPAPNAAFLMVDDLRFTPLRRYVGQGREYRTGSIMISVMCPLSWTPLQCTELAGKVADHFPSPTKMTYDGITVTMRQNAHIVNSGYRDGEHFRLTVACPWWGLV